MYNTNKPQRAHVAAATGSWHADDGNLRGGRSGRAQGGT